MQMYAGADTVTRVMFGSRMNARVPHYPTFLNTPDPPR
jgi:hypothetical protein